MMCLKEVGEESVDCVWLRTGSWCSVFGCITALQSGQQAIIVQFLVREWDLHLFQSSGALPASCSVGWQGYLHQG